LSWHRRQTCSIIVLPAINASGLPGNRVEAYRAGMIATGAPAAILASLSPTAREIPPRPPPVHPPAPPHRQPRGQDTTSLRPRVFASPSPKVASAIISIGVA